MSPAAKKEAALYLQETYKVSERRVCRVISLPRTTDTQLTSGGDHDLAPCLNKTAKDVEWHKAKFRFYVNYTCSAGGLAKYDGAEWKTLGENLCPQAEGNTSTMVYNLEIDIHLSGEENGKLVTSKSLQAELTSTNGTVSCSATYKGGVWVLADGCVTRKLETNDDAAKSFIIGTYTSRSLTHSDSDTYYRTGAIDFDINSWKGSMSYTGANERPSFTATNGSETIQGAFIFGGPESSPKKAAEQAPIDPPAEEAPEAETPDEKDIESETPPIQDQSPQPMPLWSGDVMKGTAKDAVKKAKGSLRIK